MQPGPIDMDTRHGPVIYTIANSNCGPPGERQEAIEKYGARRNARAIEGSTP